MKLCSKCHVLQHERKFHHSSATADGLQAYCKKCQRELHKTWCRANKAQIASMARRAYERKRQIKRILLIQQLKDTPHVDLPTRRADPTVSLAKLTCAKCGKEKSPLLFPRRKASPTGRHKLCSACLKERRKRKKRTTKGEKQ
jgi:NMD protein affecting ribosome stability and mRNA decay